jgi:hypothetical protein
MPALIGAPDYCVHTCDGLIHPSSDTLHQRLASLGAGDGPGKELPIALGVQVPAVKWKSIPLQDGKVPFALVFVNIIGDEMLLLALCIIAACAVT